MHLLISPSDGLPIYRQIMRQIMDAIAGGHLKSGDRLMSHRDLSEQLVIAPLTVKKAYDELEHLGYIETHRGRGTFVATRLPKVARAAQADLLAEGARALLARAYLAGLEFSDVLDALKAADRAIADGPTSPHRKKGRSA